MAGIAVDLAFYPLETIKTRIMGSSPGENLTSIARSRFRGFSCQMIVSFPYSFSFFYTYESIRAAIPNNPMKNVYASICAEVIGNLVRNPFEVIKQQMMVGRSDKIMVSLLEIARLKGLRGFYIGYQSTLARDIVFSGFQLPIFEYLREKNYLQLSQTLNYSLSGATAALISGFISCPLDVLKTRLMTQNMKLENASNLIHQIYSESGLGGFFKGVGFRCGILCFGGIIYFGALQRARNFLEVK
jgi:solute carrier family 25 S-adenosylmethionine transporter 26